MTLNQAQLDAVVEAAKAKAAGNVRWVRAIERAAECLHSNPWIHDEGDGLLILSESGQIYKANGVCQCRAYELNQPCWHRAAKLVKRYKEAVLAAASPTYQTALASYAAGRINLPALYDAAVAAGLTTEAAAADVIELNARKAAASPAPLVSPTPPAAPAAPVLATLPAASACVPTTSRIVPGVYVCPHTGQRIPSYRIDGFEV